MPNYCTVCGVKLTAKNKISYRPSSCRDCELERKRLYSLKRKVKNELEEKSTKGSTKATKTAVSAAKAVKSVKTVEAKLSSKSSESKAKAKSSPKSVELVTPKITEKKDTKTVVSKEIASKKSKKEESSSVLVDDVEIKSVSSKAETDKKPSSKEKNTANSKASKAVNSKADLASKKKKTKDSEDDVDEIEIIEEDLEDDLAIDTPSVAKVVKPVSAPIIIPSYIKEAAKIQVKKRRLGNVNSVNKSKLNNQTGDSLAEDVSSVFALGKNLTEEDLLRAPSDTPWESSSFKIVDGSFVEHGAEDQDEAKGPSPEEIKNIIERIRLEHKTRRG